MASMERGPVVWDGDAAVPGFCGFARVISWVGDDMYLLGSYLQSFDAVDNLVPFCFKVVLRLFYSCWRLDITLSHLVVVGSSTRMT